MCSTAPKWTTWGAAAVGLVPPLLTSSSIHLTRVELQPCGATQEPQKMCSTIRLLEVVLPRAAVSVFARALVVSVAADVASSPIGYVAAAKVAAVAVTTAPGVAEALLVEPAVGARVVVAPNVGAAAAVFHALVVAVVVSPPVAPGATISVVVAAAVAVVAAAVRVVVVSVLSEFPKVELGSYAGSCQGADSLVRSSFPGLDSALRLLKASLSCCMAS